MGLVKEADVLRDTLYLLGLYRKQIPGLDFFRISTSGVPRETKQGIRFSKNSSAGMADIYTSVIIKDHALPIWLECKRPHKNPESLLSENQIEFRRRITQCGNLYVIITDPIKQLPKIYLTYLKYLGEL